MAARKNRGTKDEPCNKKWRNNVSQAKRERDRAEKREQLAAFFPQAMDVLEKALAGEKITGRQWQAASKIIDKYVANLQSIDSNVTQSMHFYVSGPPTMRTIEAWTDKHGQLTHDTDQQDAGMEPAAGTANGVAGVSGQ